MSLGCKGHRSVQCAGSPRLLRGPLTGPTPLLFILMVFYEMRACMYSILSFTHGFALFIMFLLIVIGGCPPEYPWALLFCSPATYESSVRIVQCVHTEVPIRVLVSPGVGQASARVDPRVQPQQRPSVFPVSPLSSTRCQLDVRSGLPTLKDASHSTRGACHLVSISFLNHSFIPTAST